LSLDQSKERREPGSIMELLDPRDKHSSKHHDLPISARQALAGFAIP
jgi:hypothetical protein